MHQRVTRCRCSSCAKLRLDSGRKQCPPSSPYGDVSAVPKLLRAHRRLEVGGGVAGRQVAGVAVHERLVGTRRCELNFQVQFL